MAELLETPNLRVCSKCQESKPLDAVHFPPSAHCRYGLQGVCRVCKRAHLNQYNAAKRARAAQEAPPVNFAVRERVCTRCGQSKSLDAVCFSSCALSRDGLSRWCRNCQRVYNTENARKNRDRRNAQRRERRRANPEKTKADRKRYYQMYKEKERQTYHAWKQRNPTYYKEWERARRALFTRLLSLADAVALIGVQEATIRTAMRDGRMAGLYRKNQWWVFRDEAQAWKDKRDKGPQVQAAFSLDAAKEGAGSFHEWIADPNALNPMQVVMMQETAETLLSWVANELAEEEQAVLLTYADSAFDARAVALALQKPLRSVQRILGRVQERARTTFGYDILAA